MMRKYCMDPLSSYNAVWNIQNHELEGVDIILNTAILNLFRILKFE